MKEEFILFQENKTAKVIYSEREDSAVKRAVQDLISDIGKVRGSMPQCGALEDGIPEGEQSVVVVTLDRYETLKNTVFAGHECGVSKLYDADGARRWEGYTQQVMGDTLYIIGSDRRGPCLASMICVNRSVSRRGISGRTSLRKEKRFLRLRRITIRRTGRMSSTGASS